MEQNSCLERAGRVSIYTSTTKAAAATGLAYERNFGNVTFNVIQNPPNYAVIALISGQDIAQMPIFTAVAGPLAGSGGTKALPSVSLRAVNPNI